MWRKKLDIPKVRTTIWFTEEVFKRLDAECSRTGITKADFVNLAVAEYFARHFEAHADVK